MKDRCQFQPVYLSPAEKLDYIEKVIIPSDYKDTSLQQRMAAFQLMRDAVMVSGAQFSFREYRRILDCYILDQSNIDIHVRAILSSGSLNVIVLSALRESPNDIEAAVRKFVKLTGQSRRSFFNHKKKCESLLA